MSLTVEKCLQAWTNSLRQMNTKADIVFFGDSMTYYGDFSSVFPDKQVCNLGLRGDTIQNMIDRVEQVKVLEPKCVFLMAGINDVKDASVEEFEELYSHLVDSIIHVAPFSSLVIQSFLPVNSQDFIISCNNQQVSSCNSCIEKIAKERNFKYVDLFSIYEVNGQLPSCLTKDGIHLVISAYRKWYEAISNIF